jgi:hypothetical protein
VRPPRSPALIHICGSNPAPALPGLVIDRKAETLTFPSRSPLESGSAIPTIAISSRTKLRVPRWNLAAVDRLGEARGRGLPTVEPRLLPPRSRPSSLPASALPAQVPLAPAPPRPGASRCLAADPRLCQRRLFRRKSPLRRRLLVRARHDASQQTLVSASVGSTGGNHH